MRNRSLTGTLAVAAGILTAGVLAPATTLAGVSLHLDTFVGSPCVDGFKPTDGPITVKWLRPNGTTRATRTDDSDDDDWSVCFNAVPAAGDKIRMTTAAGDQPGNVTRTVRIPDLTVALDRVSNVIRGYAPTGVQLSIDYYECDLSDCVDTPLSVSATANGQGRYRKDISGSADIDGGDRVVVAYEKATGDAFKQFMVGRFMEVRARNKISVGWQPKGTTTVTLRKSDGTLRAAKSLTVPFDGGFASGSFRTNGHPVNVSVGNRITADFASDALLVWPVMSVDGSGTVVSGRCLKNAAYQVSIQDGSSNADSSGTTDANGGFADDLSGEWTFKPGDRLDLICQSKPGDIVHLIRTI